MNPHESTWWKEGLETKRNKKLSVEDYKVAVKWQHRMNDPHIKHLRFLFRPYSMRFWWFSVVDILRRLLLTCALLFFGDPGKQLFYVVVLCLFFTNVYRECQPYDALQHNIVSYGSL